MARTPLFGALRRMARTLRRARTQGLPPEMLLQQAAVSRGERGLTRRAFLGTALAAGAGLLAPKPRAAGCLTKSQRVAIVGAGISGLNCALTLADAGIASTVYEASGRLGGRMFSNRSGYWVQNQVSEWCGELIDSGHTTIQALATRFGLALDDLRGAEPEGSDETYYFAGQYYSHADAVADFAPVLQAVTDDANAAGYPTTFDASTAAGRQLDNMSVYDWIEQRVPDGHRSKIGQLLSIAYSAEYGADTQVQSALNLVYLLSGSDEDFEIFGESDEHYHIRGGNQQLPSAIAAHLATLHLPVRLGATLVAIRKRPDGRTSLIFVNGAGYREVVADAVVLTLPFAVLRTLNLTHAGFDALKRKTIDQLGRGHNGKLQLQFSSRLWNRSGPWGLSNGSTYADTGYQNTWDVTRAQSGSSGILNNYTGGLVTDRQSTTVPFAFTNLSAVRRDAAAFLGKIAPVFPGLTPLWNGRGTSSLPHLSPHFRCAYSYWKVGQYQTIAGYEAVPQGNIYFAGEHTSIDFQGFMEGAAAEGARAAGEVFAQLGVTV